MKTKIPIITDRKINRQTMPARCLGNFNLVFRKVKIGNSKTANKNANKTGVKISFPAQNIKAELIKVIRIKASFA